MQGSIARGINYDTQKRYVQQICETLLQRRVAVAAGDIVLAADENEGDGENHGGHSPPQLELLFSVR